MHENEIQTLIEDTNAETPNGNNNEWTDMSDMSNAIHQEQQSSSVISVIWATQNLYLQIYLSSNATISMNDNLIISSNAFTYFWRNNIFNLENDMIINNILPANNPIEPQIIIDISSHIKSYVNMISI